MLTDSIFSVFRDDSLNGSLRDSLRGGCSLERLWALSSLRFRTCLDELRVMGIEGSSEE